MTRFKFEELTAGKTFYGVTLRVNADGTKATTGVDAVRVLSRPKKEARIPEVDNQVRWWRVKLFSQKWFEELPKPTEMFCFIYGLYGPGESIEQDSSLKTLAFSSRKAAFKAQSEFLQGYVPTEQDLENARNREARDASSFNDDDDENEDD